MGWFDCTMYDAIKHAGGRIPLRDGVRPDGLSFDFDYVRFTDGTAVACRSEWIGPYSGLTPDIDADAPIWMVFKEDAQQPRGRAGGEGVQS